MCERRDSGTRLLSVTHAAEQLDCSRGHIYGLIAAGKLTAVEIKATGTRSKTRVRAEEIEALIKVGSRTGVARAPRRTEPQPDLYPHHAVARPADRPTYTTPQAAAWAQVELRALTDALSKGRLHGRQSKPRGPWRIDHACLVAWEAGARCPHQDEGGGSPEARHVDGT